jgi:hypothetical protein
VKLALVILALLAAVASAQIYYGPDAEFLSLLPDARTSGLGGCGTALTDLGANTWYNPACLGFSPRVAATWTHVDLLPYEATDESFDHAGVACRCGEHLGIAVNAIYLQTGEVGQYDEHYNPVGVYRPFDLAPSLSAAYRILPGLSAGATVKPVYSLRYPRWAWEEFGREYGTTYDGDAFTLAFDAGVLYRPLRALTLGLAVANLGPNLRYDTTAGYRLPRRARLGIAVNPPIPGPVGVTVLGDIGPDLVLVREYPTREYDDSLHGSAGLELGFAGIAFLRLGYFHGVGWPGHGFTWGVGLEYQGLKVDVGGDDGVYENTDRNIKLQLSARL